MQRSQKIIFSKERPFGDKVSATFTFIQQNFSTLGRCLLYIAGPFILIQAILISFLQMELLDIRAGGTLSANWWTLYGIMGPLISFFYFLSTALVGLVVYEFILLYTDNTVEEFDIKEVFTLVKKDFLKVLLTSIGAFLVIGLAFMILILPGIYMAVALSFIIFVRIKEKLSFSQSVSRCIDLINGKWWSTFGLILIMVIIQSILSGVFSLPLSLLGSINDVNDFEYGSVGNVAGVLSQAVSNVFSTFLSSLGIIAVCFQYFNLVERKESRGLIERIESIGIDRNENNEETY